MAPKPSRPALAPGVPADYYRRIHDAELTHWWYRGMREISAALLGRRLTLGGSILDAGCGTGGFLRWALDVGCFSRACGVDMAGDALKLAAQVVPEADLRQAALSDLPVASARFDLVAVNDVLQHVAHEELARTLSELARVVSPSGCLLVRTNGGWRARTERDDWRLYDRSLLCATLAATGLRCERITYANVVPSIAAALRRRVPHAPQPHSDGIPAPERGRPRSAVALSLLRAEARYLAARPSASLPYGHTLLAVCSRA